MQCSLSRSLLHVPPFSSCCPSPWCVLFAIVSVSAARFSASQSSTVVPAPSQSDPAVGDRLRIR